MAKRAFTAEDIESPAGRAGIPESLEMGTGNTHHNGKFNIYSCGIHRHLIWQLCHIHKGEVPLKIYYLSKFADNPMVSNYHTGPAFNSNRLLSRYNYALLTGRAPPAGYRKSYL